MRNILTLERPSLKISPKFEMQLSGLLTGTRGTDGGGGGTGFSEGCSHRVVFASLIFVCVTISWRRNSRWEPIRWFITLRASVVEAEL